MWHSLSAPILVVFIILFNSITEARLTPDERQSVFQESPTAHLPDYCSACLRKAMINHFPHACYHTMPDPITFASTHHHHVKPEIARCVCIAFMDPQWMRSDCRIECEFARYDEAMAMIPRVSDFPGCERWIDMRTVTELELRGLPKRDPDYQPAVYNYEDDDGDSNSDSWSWRDGCMEKLTEEGILEEEDEEECDLDQDDDDDAIVVNGSWFNGYREEL